MEYISKFVWFQEGPGVRKNQYTTDGVKLLNVANLVNGKINLATSKRYISPDEAYGRYKHFLVDEGDLIIASSGIQVNYFDKKMGFITKEHLPLCMNTSTIRFKTLDKDVLDINYFMYFMKSKQFKSQLRRLITGSAQLNFGSSHLEKIKMNVPSMQMQKECIKKLNIVTNIIETKKQQINIMDNLVKSQFVEMFITNRNASWRLKKLKEVCIFNPKKLEISNVPDDFKVSFIPMTAVSENGEIDTSDIRDYKEVNRGFTYFSENDVLFAKITPCMENGKGAVAINLKNKIGFGSTEFHVVRPKETMNSRWIYTLFSLSFFRNEAEKNMTGSAGQKRVPIKFIENYEIFVPPIELQNQFADFVQHIDKLEFARIGQIDSAKANPFLAIKKKPQFY